MNSKGKKADLSFLSIDKFSKDDEYQYNMIIAIWTSMVDETIPSCRGQFSRYIGEYGLIRTIRDCCDIADRLLSGFDNRVIQSVELSLRGLYSLFLNSGLDMDRILTLLRFAKRYTWNNMDAIEKLAIAQFKQNNNRIKMLDRRGINPLLARDLRFVFNSFCPKRLKHYEPDPFYDLPTGATADTPKTKACKLLGLLRQMPELLPDRVINPANPSRCSEEVFVPKSYKDLRGICKEPVYTNFKATALRDEVIQVLESTKGKYHPGGRVLTQDQDRNRGLVRRASATGLSTIDLSAASDSISASFVSALWPDLASKVADLRSNETRYKNQRIPLYVFVTMGFRVTFDLESLGFWCCICVAHLWAETLGHELYDLDDCSVFGDDIIIPDGLVAWLLPILQACGFRVNTSKSYTNDSGRFRESCGTDVLDGHELITCYWPRKALNRTSSQPLVALQNRLFLTDLFPVTADLLGDILQKDFKLPDANVDYIQDAKTLSLLAKDHSDFAQTLESPLAIMRKLPILHNVPLESYSYTKYSDKTVRTVDDRYTLVPTGKWVFEEGKVWYEYKSGLGARYYLPRKERKIPTKVMSKTTTTKSRVPKFGTDNVQLGYYNLDNKFKYCEFTGLYGRGIVVEVATSQAIKTGMVTPPSEWGLSQKEFINAVEYLRYCEFLAHGPRYLSPLDELLKVSTRTTQEDFLCSTKEGFYDIKRSKSWILDVSYDPDVK